MITCKKCGHTMSDNWANMANQCPNCKAEVYNGQTSVHDRHQIDSNFARKTNVILFEIPSGEKASSGLAEALKNVSGTKINLGTSTKIEKLGSLGLNEDEITIIQNATPIKKGYYTSKKR